MPEKVPCHFVFLHGGNHGSWCWRRLIDVLQDRFEGKMLALDVPGCGTKRSSPASHALGLSELAETFVNEIRQANIHSAVLVGHSMAGVVLPYLAQRAPDLFSRVIFVSSCVPRLGESVMQTMGSGVRGDDPAVVGYPLDPTATDPLELMRAMFAPGLSTKDIDWLLHECALDHWPMSLAMEPLAVDVKKIAIPTTYIVTEQDPILPPPWQGRFAERVGAQQQLAIDAAHEVFLSHPIELADLIERALVNVDSV